MGMNGMVNDVSHADAHLGSVRLKKCAVLFYDLVWFARIRHFLNHSMVYDRPPSNNS